MIITPEPVGMYDHAIDPHSGDLMDTYFEIIPETRHNISDFVGNVRNKMSAIRDNASNMYVSGLPQDEVISIQHAAGNIADWDGSRVDNPSRTDIPADMAIWHVINDERYILNMDETYVGMLHFTDYLNIIHRYDDPSPLSEVIGQVPRILRVEALDELGVDMDTWVGDSPDAVVVLPFFDPR